jgi:hypothetical protein
MFKATREFINERQPHTEITLKVVDVKKIGGGNSNNCSDNAIDFSESNDGYMTVTGWLIHPYNQLTNSTDIVQNWWNVDEQMNYVDTTPDPLKIACEYVLDFDLYKYAFDNYDQLESIVACSLVLSDGRYTAALADKEDITNVRYRKISILDNKTLYTFF